MHPIYRELYAGFYSVPLTDSDVATLEWRAGLLLAIRPRIICPRRSTPQKVAITDAAAETMITAAIVFDKATFDVNRHALVFRGARAASVWEELFVVANLIYGLELTATLLTAADPLIPLDGQCATYYLDNNNSLASLVRSDSQRGAISGLSRIFWPICAVRGIAPWLEMAPSDRNIADNPSRGVQAPFIIDEIADFFFEMELFRTVKIGLGGHRAGIFGPTPLIGRLYPPTNGRTTEGCSGDNQQILDFRRCR